MKSLRHCQKILFVRTDRIGDVLMNLPALRTLRQTFPKAWIALLVDQNISGLLNGHPDLDEILYVSMGDWKKNFTAKWRLARKIRAIGFDLAIVSNSDKWLHWTVFAARIPERVGYRRKWGFFLTRTVTDRKSDGSRHEIESNLDLVKLVSERAWDGGLAIPMDLSARESIEKRLAGGGMANQSFVVVHPGSSNPQKRWGVPGFSSVCQTLWDREALRTILVGGEEEKKVSRQILEQTKNTALDWTGALSLKELVALLGHKKARALVSCDSGPVHIAWMSGTPVVALYAKNCAGSDPIRWGPRDPKSRVIFGDIREIRPEEVYRSLDEVLHA